MKKIIAIAALCLAGTASAQQQEIRIGAIVTLSGAGAAWGQAMLYATELAADDVERQGRAGDRGQEVPRQGRGL